MQKTPQQIYEELKAPFTRTVNAVVYPDLKWKPQTVIGNRFLCVPFIDRDLVINRLNDVLGIDGWQFTFEREQDGTKSGILSIKVDNEWIRRSDTGTKTQTEAEKGSTSDALKRCATLFGVGTYIYRVNQMYVNKGVSTSGKPVPVDHNKKPLYGDSLSDFCNGMSTEQGILAQLLIQKPELFQRDDIKKLWNEFKRK